jgi:type III pantothenate kinase
MKFDLALDIGNTWIKGAYFEENGEIVHNFRYKDVGTKFYNEVNNLKRPIQNAIISNVRKLDESLIKINASEIITLNPSLTYPFKSSYTTPQTLGMDRVSAICGGMVDFPNEDLLVITAGTCITYNILTADNTFLGGGISPGLTMRYKALNKFTGKLPFVHHKEFDNLIGMDTEECILSGVQSGLLSEVDEVINKYRSFYPEIIVLMSGGATVFFENKLKNKIFADPNLIFKGLYYILKVNVK